MSFATIGEPKILLNRGTYLPEWTPVFADADLDTEVRHGAKALGFTLRQMLPERRWAVAPNGVLISQDDFEKRYVQWASMTVRDGRLWPISIGNPYFDPKVIPVPLVERFVAVTHDYQGREIPIGFDPNKPPNPSAKPIVLKDANGNEVNPLAPRDEKIQRLTVISDLKERGVLTAEQASSEMAAILLEPQKTAPPVLEGFSVVAPTTPDETILYRAACGFEARSKAGVLAHGRHCENCLAMPAEASDTESALSPNGLQKLAKKNLPHLSENTIREIAEEDGA